MSRNRGASSPSAAAIANAVADALKPLGVEINHLPLGPDRLLRLIPEKAA